MALAPLVTTWGRGLEERQVSTAGLGSKLYLPQDERRGGGTQQAQALIHKTAGFTLFFQLKTLFLNPKNSPALMTVVNRGRGMGPSSLDSGPSKPYPLVKITLECEPRADHSASLSHQPHLRCGSGTQRCGPAGGPWPCPLITRNLTAIRGRV